MKLRSHIDFPAFAFQKYNARSELMGIVTTSALFDIPHDGPLRAAPEQREIQLSDEYSDVDGTHLVRPADFVPFRPTTDVTALATAHSPQGEARQNWTVGIMVQDVRYVLRVHGKRHWYYDRWKGWTLSDAEPATSVPLGYHLAWGGPSLLPDGHPDQGEVDIWNPIGPGTLHRETPRKAVLPAPQIEAVDDPIVDPYKVYQPQGYAPISPVWRFRERHAGTYDDTWAKTQHPFLPKDFDPAFYSVAHPSLQIKPLLRGDEVIRAANLFPGRPDITFSLPGLAFGAVVTYENGEAFRLPLVLDGVHLELLGQTPQVRLTWRISVPWNRGIRFLDLGEVNWSDAATLQQPAGV